LAFTIAFFIVNIFLLLQFIPVGSAVHADRYAYVPSIGFYILAAVLIVRYIENKQKSKQLIFVVTGLYIAFLTVLTVQRSDIWQNSELLWDDTIEKSPNSVIAWNNRGSLKDKKAALAMEELRFEDAKNLRFSAIEDFSQAVKGKPDYKNAYYNRGVSRYELGKLTGDSILLVNSISDFDNAIKQDAQFTDSYHNRANAKAEVGLFESAIKDFDIALSLKPDDYNYYTNRGVTKGKMGKVQEAIDDFNSALELNSNEPAVYSNRGRAKMLLNDIEGAIIDYNTAVQLDPTHHTAYFNRALAKNRLNDKQGALEDLNQTIRLHSNMPDAYYWRAVIYLELNDSNSACSDLTRAYELGFAYASVLLQQYCR
jgi:tetratricopeptide (TPR) repeat protein